MSFVFWKTNHLFKSLWFECQTLHFRFFDLNWGQFAAASKMLLIEHHASRFKSLMMIVVWRNKRKAAQFQPHPLRIDQTNWFFALQIFFTNSKKPSTNIKTDGKFFVCLFPTTIGLISIFGQLVLVNIHWRLQILHYYSFISINFLQRSRAFNKFYCVDVEKRRRTHSLAVNLLSTLVAIDNDSRPSHWSLPFAGEEAIFGQPIPISSIHWTFNDWTCFARRLFLDTPGHSSSHLAKAHMKTNTKNGLATSEITNEIKATKLMISGEWQSVCCFWVVLVIVYWKRRRGISHFEILPNFVISSSATPNFVQNLFISKITHFFCACFTIFLLFIKI